MHLLILLFSVLLYKKILDVVRFLKKSLFSQFYNENEQKHEIDPLGLIGMLYT